MWEVFSSVLKYLQAKPEVIALLTVVGVLCFLLIAMMRVLTRSLEKIGAANMIMAELTALVKVLVYGKGRP